MKRELDEAIKKMENSKKYKKTNFIKESEREAIKKMMTEIDFSENIEDYDVAEKYPLMNIFGFIKPKFDLNIDVEKARAVLFKMIQEEIKYDDKIIKREKRKRWKRVKTKVKIVNSFNKNRRNRNI